MRQDLDLSSRREVERRIEKLLSYYLPELGPEHRYCLLLREQLRRVVPLPPGRMR